MPYTLTIYRDGESFVSEIECNPNHNGDIAAQIPFETLVDAHNAKNVHNIAKMQSSEDKAESEVQAEIIRSLSTEIDNQKLRIVDMRENITNLQNAFYGLRCIIRRVMFQLALQNTIQNTHSERNADNRAIVEDLKYWYEKPSNTYASRSMGDIPF